MQSKFLFLVLLIVLTTTHIMFYQHYNNDWLKFVIRHVSSNIILSNKDSYHHYSKPDIVKQLVYNVFIKNI